MALRSYKEITGVRIHLSRKNGILKSRKSSSRFPEIIIIFSFLFSYHSEAAQLPKMRSLPRTHDPLLIRPCRGFFLWAQNALVISVSSIRKPFWRTEITGRCGVTGRPGSKENEEAVERLCIPYTHKKSKQLSFQRQIAFILAKLVQDVRGG